MYEASRKARTSGKRRPRPRLTGVASREAAATSAQGAAAPATATRPVPAPAAPTTTPTAPAVPAPAGAADDAPRTAPGVPGQGSATRPGGMPAQLARSAQAPSTARRDHLTEQLAGHLTALLTVTSTLQRRLASAADAAGHAGEAAEAALLRGQHADATEAAGRIEARIAQLVPGQRPLGIWEGSADPEATNRCRAGLLGLHGQARKLAARVLVVAASRQDTTTSRLACDRIDAHAAAAEQLAATAA
ncbi:hypothetical protein [Allostreptomyces psammosilenae]|uniref:Uncharacterized protein n=1 Tax=Allostreptomyces psammosilenae TaxID=1892865 RepID=A0A852ZV16_9ACTN|nr:hypothetical protein [Allostreptomyces psammosilenae]NYI06099.1 hypothetical protein [Allostreptomyces psammosilenae]